MQILSRVSAATALCLVATTASAGVVLANNPAGDAFNGGLFNQGQAVGASGWYYNNVRNGGTVGIDDVYARSGNGSVFLKGTAGPGGFSSKGDIEYLSGATSNWFTGNATATTSLGLFSQFSGMRYDWYRDSASTNNAAQHPVLRILLDRDGDLNTSGDRGGLVFERAYNGGSVATNQWLSDVVGGSTNLWSFGMGFAGLDPDGGSAYDSSLAEWQAALRDAKILGFSAGFGSGWGPFQGAVDNIGWTINGVATTTNFEARPDVGPGPSAVPEPGSLALIGLGLGLLGFARRRG